MKLFLTNIGHIKILISFSLILSLPFSHNPSLTEATLISSPGTGRYLQLISLATYAEMYVEDGRCQGIFNTASPSETQ